MSAIAYVGDRRRKSAEPWRSHDGAPKPSIERPIRTVIGIPKADGTWQIVTLRYSRLMWI